MDLSLVETGLKGSFFTELQGKLEAGVFAGPVPLLGDQLATEPWGEVAGSVGERLAAFDPSATNVAAVQYALKSALGDLIVSPGIEVPVNSENEVRFRVPLSEQQTYQGAAALDLTLGRAGNADPIVAPLLEIDGAVDVEVDWTWNLEFGVTDEGFFIATVASNPSAPSDELTVDVTATLRDDFLGCGRLGMFSAVFRPGPGGTSHFDGTFAVDLVDPDGDGMLTTSEFAGLQTETSVDGGGNAYLHADAAFIPDFSPWPDVTMPWYDPTRLFNLAIRADVEITYAAADVSAAIGSGADSVPATVRFDTVQMDMGEFLDGFVVSTFQVMKDAMDPFDGALKFLAEQQQGYLSQFGGDCPDFVGPLYLSLMELSPVWIAGAAYDETVTSLALIKRILELDVPDGGTLWQRWQDVGSFAVKVADHVEVLKESPNGNLLQQLPYQVEDFFACFGNSLSFPVLDHPEQVFKLMRNETTTMPMFRFGTEAELEMVSVGISIEVPVLKIASVNFHAYFGISLNYDFSYDSAGLEDFSQTLDYSTSMQGLASSTGANLGLLRDGFILDDHNEDDARDGNVKRPWTLFSFEMPTSGEQWEAAYYFRLEGGISVGGGIPFVGGAEAGGSISFCVDWFHDLNDLPNRLPEDEWRDPNPEEGVRHQYPEDPADFTYDGKVRLGEQDLICNVNPADLWNQGLSFSALIDLYAKYWFMGYEKEYHLKLAEMSFGSIPFSEPNDETTLKQKIPSTVLGNVDETGNLTLYVGPQAGNRDIPPLPFGKQETENESVTIKSLTPDDQYDPDKGETVLVTFQDYYRQEFEGVKRIIADGGTGEDYFNVDQGTRAPATLHGGAGDDRLIYLGGGQALIDGDDGQDVLVGGPGQDLLQGGAGDDTLYGGGGDDTLKGESGNDELFGGDGDDRLEGGPGNDRLLGEAGDDTLLGDDGDDFLDGGPGVDVLEGGAGSDHYSWNISTEVDTITEPLGTSDCDLVMVHGGPESDTITLRADESLTCVDTNQGMLQFALIETVGVAAGAGCDAIFIENLRDTDVEQVVVDLKALGESGAETSDTVCFRGGDGSDDIRVEGVLHTFEQSWGSGETSRRTVFAPSVRIAEGSGDWEVHVFNSSPVRDRLEILGLAGDDALAIEAGADDVRLDHLIALRLDGGDGNDLLSTVYSNVDLVGGPGYDTLRIQDYADHNGGVRVWLDAATAVVLREWNLRVLEHHLFYADTFEAMQLDLSPNPNGNEVSVLGTIPGPVTISGSEGNDAITIVETQGELSVNGGGEVENTEGDTLVVDRSSDTNGLRGTLSAHSIAGLGFDWPVLYGGVEGLTVDLGSGADGLTITGTSAQITTVNAGGGDDEVSVWAIGDLTSVNGDEGDDTVRLCIPDPNNLAESPFDDLTFWVETLLVDHTGDQPTAWRIEDGRVWVDKPQGGGSIRVVDLIGSEQVTVDGGTSGEDTLTVVDNVPDPQSVRLEEGTVFIQHGGQILSFNSLTFKSTEQQQPVPSGSSAFPLEVSGYPAGATLTDVEVTVDIERGDAITHDYVRQLMDDGGLTLAHGAESYEVEHPLLVDRDGHTYVRARLSSFDGQVPNGAWTLTVENPGQPLGTLNGWSLRLTDDGRDFLDDPPAALAPVITPDGQHIYSVGPGERGEPVVRVFGRDTVSGDLSPVKGSQLLPSDGAADDRFGYSVAISGDTAIIGAWGDDDNGDCSGSAYIFEKAPGGGWMQTQKLTPADGATGDFFGWSVAISGNTAIIGAPDDDNCYGSAYVFERDTTGTWIETQRLAEADTTGGPCFGWSVAIYADSAIIGAPFGYINYAYIFERDAAGIWMETQKVPCPDGHMDTDFGRSVAIFGQTAVIGRPGDNSAYVLERAPSGGWTQTHKLTPDSAFNGFGYSVGVYGDTAIIGSWLPSRVYTFDRGPAGGWMQTQELTGVGGWSVAISGNTAISAEDSAHILERDAAGGWMKTQTLLTYEYGPTVAISGNTAIIGAYSDELSGSAFVFERDTTGGFYPNTFGGARSIALSPDGEFLYVPRPRALVNAALDGVASQSSTVFGCVASRAIDGNTDGVWEHGSVTCTGNDFDEAWWEVDLRGTHELEHILLHNRSDGTEWRLSNFRLSVYHSVYDPESEEWIEVEVFGQDYYTDQGYVDPVAGLFVPLLDGTVGDRVRVQLLGPNKYHPQSGSLSLAEVEVFCWAPDAVSTIRRNPMTGRLTFTDELRDSGTLAGADLVKISHDGALAYVATDSGVSVFERDQGSGALTTVLDVIGTATLGRPTAIEISNDNQYVYITGDQNHLQAFLRNGTNHTQIDLDVEDPNTKDLAISHPSALALSPDQEYLYVAARDDSAISVFSRDDNGTLEFEQIVRNGSYGVRGLGGVASLVVTQEYVFAVGEEEDSLVALKRDESTGRLTFAQRLRNLSGGVEGLENPNSVVISPDGRFLYVGSSGSAGGVLPGGMAWFSVDQDAPPPAPPLVVGYSGIEALTVRSAGGDDLVSVRGVGEGLTSLTLQTGEGSDTVVVQRSPGSVTTTVSLGEGNDELDLRGTDESATTVVYGDAGDDTIRVWGTGELSTTTIVAGDGDDTIRVAGDALEATVTVDGGPQTNPGDTLLFDAGGEEVTTTGSIPGDGTIALVGREGVAYTSIEGLELLDALPSAVLVQPDPIREGDTLQLDASGSDPRQHEWTQVDWDVDGDGQFGDLVGLTPPELSWSDLQELGLDDDGEYQVAVRVATSVGFDVATATVTINNLPPTLTVSSDSASVDQFTPYRLHLTASDPGDDTIEAWMIDWGDGSEAQVQGNEAMATHKYAPGTYPVSVVQATDEDGTYPVSWLGTVEVEAKELLTGAVATQEGQTYELTVDGSPAFGDPTWIIDWGDGSPTDSAQGVSAVLQHTFLDDSARADGGALNINATILAADGIYRATKLVTVGNVGPTLLAAGLPQVDEGSPYTLLLDAHDPGDDRITEWRIDWGDGTEAQTLPGTVQSARHVYADDSAGQPGEVYQIQVTAVDEDTTWDQPYAVSRVAILDRAVFQSDPATGGTGHFYILTSEAGPWADAQQEAESLGGYLAAIAGSSEQDFLDAAFFSMEESPERLWIGLWDEDGDGTFEWVTGEPLDYTRWAAAGPAAGDHIAMVRREQADPTVIGFDALAGGETTYAENGFELHARSADGSDSELVLSVQEGSPAVAAKATQDEFKLEANDGAPFRLTSMDVGAPEAATLKFTGWLAGGETVEQTFALQGTSAGFRRLTFNEDFVEVTSVSWTPGLTIADDVAVRRARSLWVGLEGSESLLGVIEMESIFQLPAAAGDQLSVRVNDVAPAAALHGADQISEGDSFTLVISRPVDPGDDTISEYRVDWGDGVVEIMEVPTAGVLGRFVPSYSLSHAYADGDAVRTIRLCLVDEEATHDDVSTFQLTVHNVAPTADAGGDQTVNEGEPVWLYGQHSDPGLDDTHTFLWQVSADNGQVIDDGTGEDFSFTPVDNGLYTVTYQVTDNDGGTGTDTALITVKNVAPTIQLSGAASAEEGLLYTLTLGAVTDPGDDTVFEYVVDWGDGTVVPFASAGNVQHTYTVPNVTRTIRVGLKDEDGTHPDAGTKDVWIISAAPEITSVLVKPAIVQEGETVTLTGEFTHLGAMGIYTVLIEWGDGDDDTLNLGVGKRDFYATHQYLDDPPSATSDVYSIHVKVTDDDGDSDDQGTTVTVNNVPPTVEAGPDQTVDEGTAMTLAGWFTDPGNDTWTATVDYGDGSGSQPLTLNPDSTFALSHVYADNGVYTVTVIVWDDDMAGPAPGAVPGVDFVEDTLTVTVSNVAPTITAFIGPDLNLDQNGLPIPFSGVRGQTLFFSGSFTDPGFDNPLSTASSTGGEVEETFTYRIEWGDGTPDDTGTATIDSPGSPGSPTLGSFDASHIYTAAGAYTVTVTVTDDDTGAVSVSEKMTVAIVSMQQGGDLAIGGTLIDDRIRFIPGSGPNKIRILLNGASQGVYEPTGRLVAFGQSGDDDIQVAGSISLPAWLYGDAGDDRLKGGDGPDALFGGLGDDLLAGQSGRDVMIGGRGADKLVGNAGDDILIAGWTLYDYDYQQHPEGILRRNHEEAISAIMETWMLDAESFERASQISDPDFAYHLRSGETVRDDLEEDVLTGSGGVDWFLFEEGRDRATDVKDKVLTDDLEWILTG